MYVTVECVWSIRVCWRLSVHIIVYVHVCVCIFVCALSCMCICACVYVCVCASTYLCMRTVVCVNVYADVCICVCLTLRYRRNAHKSGSISLYSTTWYFPSFLQMMPTFSSGEDFTTDLLPASAPVSASAPMKHGSHTCESTQQSYHVSRCLCKSTIGGGSCTRTT